MLIKIIDLSSLSITGARSLITVGVIAFLYRPPWLKLSRERVLTGLMLALSLFLYVASTKLTTAANALFLMYTAPIYVVLAGKRVAGEQASRVDILCMIIVLVGTALVFADNLALKHFWGNILGVLSGIFYGYYALFVRKQKHDSPMTLTLLGHLFVCPLAAAMLTEPLPNVFGIAALIFLGVIGTAVPYALQARALERATALEGTLIPTLEIALLPIWAYLFIGETIGGSAIAGAILIVLATIVFVAQKLLVNS